MTRRFDPTSASLHGAIFGLEMPVDEWRVVEGLTLRRTFTHLIAPFILAFAPPPNDKAPHPGPWMPLAGGGLDVTTEIALEQSVRPTGFDRLNTLWFVLALLRLRTGCSAQLPFIADRPISELPRKLESAGLMPVELRLFKLHDRGRRQLQEDDLEWLTNHFAQAAALMDDPVFNRAFQTFDEAIWAHSSGAGIVVIWASIETIIRPGQRQITDRLAKAISVILEGPGPDRDRLFAKVRSCYEARGGSVHDSRMPDREQLEFARWLAREIILRVISAKGLPDIEGLLERWVARR